MILLVNRSMSMTGIEVMLMAAAYLNLCQSVNVLALHKYSLYYIDKNIKLLRLKKDHRNVNFNNSL